MLSLNERFTFKDQTVAWGTIGKGRPLVLVHGFPWSAQSWRKIAPFLARNNQVFFYDMLGCGQSQKGAHQDVSEAVQSALLVA